jgi:acetyltransferase-like isoleucine patch superfamily enzyme
MIYSGKYTYDVSKINVTNNTNGYNIYIGSFCSIAWYCKIILGGNHRIDWVTTYPFGHIHKQIFNTFDGTGHPATKGNVVIGNDVWLGNNVTIMSGVTIGDGAVIAANSHVIKNVEPYTIVGGNPCKFIKFRFTEEQINKLLQIKWWYWDDNKINDNLQLLCNDNINIFIDKHFMKN